MKVLIETARRLSAKVLVVQINNTEKIVYKNGRIYIIRDGYGVIKRKLWPREIMEIEKRLRNGDFYYS